MLEGVLRLDGTESPETYVQQHLAEFRSRFLDFFHKRGSEMQTCGRSGGRAVNLGVYRLITFLVAEFFAYVRRERHIADAVENVLENPVENESHHPFSVFAHALHHGGKFVAYLYYAADSGFSGRAHKRFPAGVVQPFQQKDFKHRLPALDMSEETGGYDAGVVDDQ